MYLGSNFVLSSLSQSFLLSTACLSSLVSSSLSVSLSRCASQEFLDVSLHRQINIPRKKRPHLSRVEDVHVLKLYDMTGVVKNPGSLPFLYFLTLHYDYIVISSLLSPSKMVGICLMREISRVLCLGLNDFLPSIQFVYCGVIKGKART